MSINKVEVKYRCMHSSCCANCREGSIALNEDYLKDLAASSEKEFFRSPKGFCRLGFSQTFKIVAMKEAEEIENQELDYANPEEHPITLLMAEHKVILAKMEKVEDQLRIRDIDALWHACIELENDLILHSGIKEEEVVFPALENLVTFGDALVSIIKEDHREVLSLLHNFRTTLEDGEISDSIIISMIVSLRSHIRKENLEFFEIIGKCIDESRRVSILEGMKKAEENYVPIKAGDRQKIAEERKAAKAKRHFIDESINAFREVNSGTGCCH